MCLAIPGQIVVIETSPDNLRSAVVDFSGVRRLVNLSFVPEAMPGDYVLVHVGFAIATVDGQAAQRTLDELERLLSLGSPTGEFSTDELEDTTP